MNGELITRLEEGDINAAKELLVLIMQNHYDDTTNKFSDVKKLELFEKVLLMVEIENLEDDSLLHGYQMLVGGYRAEEMSAIAAGTSSSKDVIDLVEKQLKYAEKIAAMAGTVALEVALAVGDETIEKYVDNAKKLVETIENRLEKLKQSQTEQESLTHFIENLIKDCMAHKYSDSEKEFMRLRIKQTLKKEFPNAKTLLANNEHLNSSYIKLMKILGQ